MKLGGWCGWSSEANASKHKAMSSADEEKEKRLKEE